MAVVASEQDFIRAVPASRIAVDLRTAGVCAHNGGVSAIESPWVEEGGAESWFRHRVQQITDSPLLPRVLQDIPNQCMFLATGRSFECVLMRACTQCIAPGPEGDAQPSYVCSACARSCHKGHKLALAKVVFGFCHCGAGDLLSSEQDCNGERPSLNCDLVDKHSSMTPFCTAVMHSNTIAMISIFEQSTDAEKQSLVEHKTVSGRTPLLLAVETANASVVELLLHMGAKLECTVDVRLREHREEHRRPVQHTPLARAVCLGLSRIATLLLVRGAQNPGVVDAKGNDALHYHVKRSLFGDYQLLESLLSKYKTWQPDAVTPHGLAKLIYLCVRHRDYLSEPHTTVDVLLNHGASVLHRHTVSALRLARDRMARGHDGMAETVELLDRWVSLETDTTQGVMEELRKQQKDAFQSQLKESGEPYTFPPVEEMHWLEGVFLSIVQDDVEQLSTALNEGQSVNTTDDKFDAPLLWWACLSHASSTARLLLSRGADASLCSAHHRTDPLQAALFLSDPPAELITLLLDCGCDPTHRNSLGHDTLSLASALQRPRACQAMQEFVFSVAKGKSVSEVQRQRRFVMQQYITASHMPHPVASVHTHDHPHSSDEEFTDEELHAVVSATDNLDANNEPESETKSEEEPLERHDDSASHDVSTGAKEVEEWLSEWRLGELLPLFQEEEFDSLEACSLMESDDIEAMGIKRGKRKLLVVALKRLRQRMNHLTGDVVEPTE